MLIKFLFFPLALYMGTALLLYAVQEKLIFFPQRTDPGARSRYAANEIRFTPGDVTLTGWLLNHLDDARRPLVVYYGGNAEDVSLNLPDFQRLPTASFLVMNYRGYGTSGGKPSETALVADALFVLDQLLADRKIDPRRVLLMGRSLGSGVAVQVAARRSVGGVVLVTPFDSLAAVAQSHYPVFPVKWLLKHRFDATALAPGITAPALFLLAQNDSIVPRRFSLRLKDLWGGPTTMLTLEGTDHNSIERGAAYWQAIESFCANVVQLSRAR